jgi:hypothetical protein
MHVPLLLAAGSSRGGVLLPTPPQVNVRRNQGLPTIFLRYMRRYRGW